MMGAIDLKIFKAEIVNQDRVLSRDLLIRVSLRHVSDPRTKLSRARR